MWIKEFNKGGVTGGVASITFLKNAEIQEFIFQSPLNWPLQKYHNIA